MLVVYTKEDKKRPNWGVFLVLTYWNQWSR